jgi:hypothetical protein
LRILVVAASQAGIDRIVDNLQRNVDLDPASILGLCRPRFEAIADAARGWHPVAMVVPITQIEGESERIDELKDALGKPLLIVR